jgi:hypothetical protein
MIDKTRSIMSSDPNTSKKKFGPYNIEVTNEECVFLFYMANLMLNAFSGIRYDRSTGIDDKISMRHGVDYLGQIIDGVKKQ